MGTLIILKLRLKLGYPFFFFFFISNNYGGLNEQNSQKSVIVYNEPCAHLYHFKFKAQSFSLPTNVIVALNIR